MDFSKINYFAVLVAALSTFVLGGLWYSPLLFGKAWMRVNNFSDTDVAGFSKARMFGWSFIFALIMSLNLSMFLAAQLTTAGFPPTRIRTQATVHLGAGPAISKIELVTEAEVPNIDAAVFNEKVEVSKKGCPVSKALAAVPEITVSATLR